MCTILLVFASIHIRYFLTYKPFFLLLLSHILEVVQHKPLLLIRHSRKFIYIHFKKFPIVLCNKRDNHVNIVKSNNRCKYFKIIKIWFLLVTFYHQFCLEMIDFSFCFVLGFIHLFDTNWLLRIIEISKLPCIIFLNCMNFFIHNFKPTIVLSSFFITLWITICK